MPDYAGAEEAIKTRLAANWSTTRITYQNETPAEPWPPRNGDNELKPWVHLEIACDGAPIHATGTLGSRVFRYEGTISVHVFTPVGEGSALGRQYALEIGEIFRRSEFYNATPGYGVRTEDPFPMGGGSKSDDGDWWSNTMTVDFIYWHRG